MLDWGGEGEEEGEAEGVGGVIFEIAMDLVEEGEDVDGGGVDVVDGVDADGVRIVNTAALTDELKGVKINFKVIFVLRIPCKINTCGVAVLVEEEGCSLFLGY